MRWPEPPRHSQCGPSPGLPKSKERQGNTLKVKIYVTLKKGILDPQGKAVEHALATLGFDSASNVRVGKFLELDLSEQAKDQAEVTVKAMCEKLLANTVIEEYHYEVLSDEDCGLRGKR